MVFWRNTRLFTSKRPTNAHGILEVIQPLVTKDMNTNLTRDFTKQDVDLALKEMAPLKALRLQDPMVYPLFSFNLSGP